METVLTRPEGKGWLVLVGGGEFSFGETMDADQAWLDRTADGPIGFVPAASGSVEYGEHLATYFRETFEREVETLPVYRVRDARRGKNLDRLGECAAVYVGGGVPDHLLDAVHETPFSEALLQRLRDGGTIVAIAAAAQALGTFARSVFGGQSIAGLQWLRAGVLEPNFDPNHDRRFRQLMAEPGVRWGLGLPAGSAVLLGPDGETEILGTAYLLDAPDGALQALGEEDLDVDSM